MKQNIQSLASAPAFLLLLVVLAICSCKKDDNNNNCPEFNNSGLVITSQTESTELPGLVSIFFKVDDSSGKPIASLTSTAFTVYEKGRNDECPRLISASESNSRISPKSQRFNFNTILVLDFSGSVINSSLSELKSAATSLVENVMPDTADSAYKMGIWWFDGENELHQLIGFTSDKDALNDAIDGLTGAMSTDPSTDLYGAVIKASDLAAGTLDTIVGQGVIGAASIVIFTDGTDQAARYTKTEALNKVNALDERITVFSIGLGSEIDQPTLKSIGTDGSIFADDKTELESKFIEVAGLVAAEANSYYLFEYCSPKRDGSGINDLIIEVTSSSKKGYLKTTFDATGFTSGCQ